MGDKILSQDEVDALLKGVVAGEVDTNAKEAPEGTHSYSLLHQERIIRGRMPTLEMVHDRFIRRQAISWTTALRCEVDFSVVSTQITKFGEVMKKVPLPSSLNVFSMQPLRGNALIVMDAMLVYLIVDHFFGGYGQTHVKPEGREFTPIQLRILKPIIGQALKELEVAWRSVQPVRIEHLRSESNPQFSMIVSGSEIVVVTTFQVQLGEAVREMFLIYPYAMLEPIKEKLYSGLVSDHVEQNSSWSRRFEEALKDCPLRVTVQLGTAKARVREVLSFAPGDVILLDQSPGSLVHCLVEGHLKFEGSAGVLKGSQAFRVTRVLG